ncbi:unnamed protein product [Rotaria sp. Silwood1]|nr:unnamed protein product [Rotaria sp. Silwood1]CAF3914024.1 unnamed protein product [Rotaria sp. Silwood1]CAF4046849.1 unnamed protein product [Rotaria sp. Silwood1]CAF4967185.1 unnamed protein product [Rotaria sp. Silwood1]CAF4970408.1 unnamed protein product [Rotaria sp. Silwood1]
MGSGNSVNVAISLDRINPFFYAGEVVSGTVTAKLMKEHVNVDQVFVVLNGETGYTTTRTVHQSDGSQCMFPPPTGSMCTFDRPNSSTRTETEYYTSRFLSEKRLLEGPGLLMKTSANLSGQYSWQFSFQLPAQLPPSINNPHNYPHVRYYLSLVIDKPWYERNETETLYLTVFPRVNLSNHLEYLMPSIIGNHNRKDVTIKGSMKKFFYVPGEIITGTLEIENPQKSTLKHIYLTLIQHYKIESVTEKKIIAQTTIPTIVHTKERQIMETFSVQIPFELLPPSYQFHGGFPHTSKVDVNYILKIEVKASGIFTNFDVSIPIIIGTESTTQPNQHQANYEASFFI